MVKAIIYLCMLTLVVLGTYGFVMGRVSKKETREEKPAEVQIILYKKGMKSYLDKQSSYFNGILAESEQLFLTADSGYRLIMTPDRIEDMKKEQIILEVLYPHIQTGTIREQLTVYFTKLLIPLTGQFSNGTVFFAGEYANRLEGKPEYSTLLEYGALTFVRNTRGLEKLRGVLQEAAFKVE
jgi:hypothetical protein